MKYKSTADATENLHLFLYGDGGAGKTKAIGDFSEAGGLVLVSTEEDGAIPLRNRGIHVPQIIPETEDDLMQCVLNPAEVVKGIPGFEGYQPRTWAFDGLRSLQGIVLEGILALPGARVAPGVPAPKDYRLLDLRMRNLVAGIEKMPYHTIITAHYEKDFDIETHLSFTGDQKNDKDITRKFQGFPSLEGYSLKYDLPNLCSSFYLFMMERNGQYKILTRNSQAAKARTRIAEAIPAEVDWTGKNLYSLIQAAMDAASAAKQ